MTTKRKLKTRTAATNISLAKKRVKYSYEKLVQGSSSLILLIFCAKNPLLRQVENRWL